MAAIEERPCGSRHGGDCCISSRRDDHDRFSRRHGGSHTCNKKLAAMAAPTPAKKLAAMAAIEKRPCGSRHGGDCCISSRRDDHDRFSRRHGGSHTCNKKLAAMAAPTPAKKLAAMAAIEKRPCGSRHGGD